MMREHGGHGRYRVTQVQAFRSADGGTVLVEVEPASGPVTRGRGPGAAVEEASETLEGVLHKLGPAIKGIVSELRAATDWPDEVTVEFAVKISADSSVIIARAGGEANFRVAMRWSRKEGA
jgi:hypothetical protein